MNDKELIQSIIEGNNLAFRSLYEKYKRLVYRTCFAIVQNKEEAEDCTQEVFIKVFNNIQKFKGDSKFSYWLYRIAFNYSLSYKRKIKMFLLKGIEESSEFVNLLQSPNSISEEIIDSVLAKAIMHLSAKQKKIFILRFIEDLSPSEIAIILDMKLNAVEVNILRAKKSVKEYILNNAL